MWQSKKPIEKLADFLDLAEKFRARFRDEYDATWVPWFRGEPDVSLETRVQPKLYRNGRKLSDQLYADQELRNEFVRRAAHLVPPHAGTYNHWDWYFLMQHVEVPTRLLDWTDNALVALYFAVRDRARQKQGAEGNAAAVYVLDPWWLNDRAFKELPSGKKSKKSKARGVAVQDWDEAIPYLPPDPFDRKLRPSIPLAVMPNHLSGRIAAQKSEFVIFGKKKGSLQEFAEGTSAQLGVVSVAAKKIATILNELDALGISESSVYPDLDGLGRELMWRSEAIIASRK